jgi:hypothetical protein
MSLLEVAISWDDYLGVIAKVHGYELLSFKYT